MFNSVSVIMKQFLLVILLFIGQFVSAQGSWKKIPFYENDIVDNYSEAYEYKIDGIGRFVFWDFDLGKFQLFCDSTSFITRSFDTPQKTYTGCVITVQTFRKNGMRASSFEVWMDKRRDIAGDCLQTKSLFNPKRILSPGREDYSWKEKMRRLFYYLKNDKGYIIIEAPVYGNKLFSMKITPVDI